jgi:hypothetical protein
MLAVVTNGHVLQLYNFNCELQYFELLNIASEKVHPHLNLTLLINTIQFNLNVVSCHIHL